MYFSENSDESGVFCVFFVNVRYKLSRTPGAKTRPGFRLLGRGVTLGGRAIGSDFGLMTLHVAPGTCGFTVRTSIQPSPVSITLAGVLPDAPCFRERAVHPDHAATPAPSTIEIEISLACVIGEATATAAIVIAVALDERRQGRVSPTIKQQGGDLIAALYNLRQKCAGDFDIIAREYGKRALAARYIQAKGKLNGSCPPFTEEMADEMVSWPLDTLHKVIATEMN